MSGGTSKNVSHSLWYTNVVNFICRLLEVVVIRRNSQTSHFTTSDFFTEDPILFRRKLFTALHTFVKREQSSRNFTSSSYNWFFVFPSCIALVSHWPAFYFVELGGWSTDGCSLRGIVNDTIICECNHMTNFAALVVSKLCCPSGMSRIPLKGHT